jgi:hypothetical protein
LYNTGVMFLFFYILERSVFVRPSRTMTRQVGDGRGGRRKSSRAGTQREGVLTTKKKKEHEDKYISPPRAPRTIMVRLGAFMDKSFVPLLEASFCDRPK